MARKPKVEPVLEQPAEPAIEAVAPVEATPAQTDPGHRVEEVSRGPDRSPIDETPVEPEIVKHSRQLLNRAEEIGVDQETIDSTPSDQLDKIVYTLERKALKLARELAKAERNDRIRDPDPPPATPKPEPVDELAFDDSGYDDGIRAMKKALREARDEIKALKGNVGQVATLVNARESRTADEMLDDAFSNLGDSYSKLFGDGGIADLKAASKTKELRLRGIVFQNAGVNFAEDSKRTIIRKIKDAANTIYGDVLESKPKPSATKPSEYEAAAAGKTTEPDEEPETAETRRWANNGLGRPTGRRDVAEKPGRAKAIRTVAALLEERGKNQNGSAEAEEAFKI